MFELQILGSQRVRTTVVAGRLADVEIIKRESLPYPPGTGREGELDPADKFMWYAPPVIIAGALAAAILSAHRTGIGAKVAGLIGLCIFAFVLNPLWVQYLDRRRGLWRV